MYSARLQTAEQAVPDGDDTLLWRESLVPHLHGDPGEGPDTVLLYGHLDKQPEMVGWGEGHHPPYGARVQFRCDQAGTGWNAPALQPWLEDAVDQASRTYFGKPAVYYGEGGSIPFMGMLGERLPDAQFLITGVLGPGSNAHGPNEFLHLPTCKSLTASVAAVLAAQFATRAA